ncbi:MAG: FtsH protease activity modulator HflK [Lysobacteraceae bacterium]
MAWNQPGGGNKDPWNGKDPGADVEAFLNKLKGSLNRVFGGSGGDSGPANGDADPGMRGLALIVLLALLAWALFDSVVLVDERERGVVMRFGKVERLMSPGPNFKWPRPIETVRKLNVTDVRSASDQVRLLTRDENIVQIDFGVQYLISDPEQYMFGSRDPDDALRQAAESAIRDVIGGSTMDVILTGERAQLAAEAQALLQKALEEYRTGLQVTVLNISNARPPQEVRQAFDDAISAREDKERIESEARAYESKVIPEARGEAARIRAEAEGYRESTITRAKGSADRFALLLEEYRKAPEVTRRRLYLETMQVVLGNNRKVYAGDGGNVLYLPLSPTQGNTAPGASMPTMLPPVTGTLNTQAEDRAVERTARPETRPGRTSRGETR